MKPTYQNIIKKIIKIGKTIYTTGTIWRMQEIIGKKVLIKENVHIHVHIYSSQVHVYP